MAKLNTVTDITKPYLMDLDEVLAIFPVSKSTWYNLMRENGDYADPNCPRSIRISRHRVGWLSTEVFAYLESKITASRKEASTEQDTNKKENNTRNKSN